MHKACFLTVMTLALVAVACGPAQQINTASRDSKAGGPNQGGVMNARISVDPYDWDISISGKSLGNGQEGPNLSGESLLGFKTGPGVGYNEKVIQAELAERWEVAPDGKTFTFYLRKGMKWPDVPPLNGRAFTSADVKFSFEYQSRTGEVRGKKLPPGQYEWMYEGMDRVETPTPRR